MKKESFRVSMAFMMKLFGKQIDDEIYSAYWEILKDIPEEDFDRIHQNLVSTFVPTSAVQFPTIAHFLQASGRAGENRSRLAVQEVKKAAMNVGGYCSVSFGDPALHETINSFGGWPYVSTWMEEQWGFNERAFIARYEANLAYGKGPSKVVGIFEIENSKKSFTEKNQLALVEQQKIPQKIVWAGYDERNCLARTENMPRMIPRGHGGLIRIEVAP